MEETEVGKGGEIRVERDDAGATGCGEGGDPGVRPAKGGEVRVAGPEFKLPFGGEGILDETNLGEHCEGMVGVPRLDGGEWCAAHHAGVCEQAEQTQHRHATKGHVAGSLIFPVATGAGVMLMVRVDESQPEIEVGKVNL